MKKFLVLWSVLCGVLASTSPVSALMVGTVDVGVKDTKIAETNQLNGESEELVWVKSQLGNDIVFVNKYDNLTASDWVATDESGTWAFYLDDSPDYFLIKTGNNQVNKFRTFLFTNNDSINWAVLDLDDIYIASVKNIGKVSHLNEYNGAPVPEPGTLLLLGSGLAGLVAAKSRRKS